MGKSPKQTPWMWGACAALLASVAASVASSPNLLQDTEEMEKWGTFRGASVTPNVLAAPDGSLTADQVNDSLTSNGARIFSASVTSEGGPYVFSCYLKAGNLTQAKLTIADAVGGSVRGYIQTSVSKDWQRYVVRIPNPPVGEQLRVEIYPGKFDRDANGYLYAWGAQLERGSTPTPYTGGDGGGSTEPPADTQPPAVPSGLTGQWVNNQLQLTWKANTESDLAVYRLQRSTDGSNFSLLASPTTASHVDGGLTAGGKYYYRVAAEDKSGNLSAYSSVFAFTVPSAPTDTQAPSVPSGLTGQHSSGAVQLTWNANTESDLALYRLQRSTDGTNFSLLASPTTASYADKSVSGGQKYHYRVAAEDKTGNLSGYSSVFSITIPVTDNPPAPPTGLAAVLNGSAIQITWAASTETDLKGYRLERGVNSTTSFSVLSSPTLPSYSDSAVLAGNNYSYRVCAVDAAGQISTPSSVVTVNIPLPSTGALNVLNFGANPATGGDDTAAVQAAFNAAAQQGKDVYFPTGHYWLTKEVIFRASGRTIYGDGNTKSIVAGNTGVHDLFELEKTQDVTVRDLRFVGSHVNTSDTANTGKAVVNNNTLRTRLLRIHSYGTGYICIDSGGSYTTLEDSICEDYGRIGYLIGPGGTVRRTRFVCQPGWRFTSEMHAVYASAGKSNITIEDSEFLSVGIYAIQLWGSLNGVATENFLIQRNRFVNCPRVMVIAAGDSGPVYRNIRFLGNTIQGTQEKSLHIGKYNGSTSNGTELLIEGNVFEDAGATWGIYLTPWGGAQLSGIRVRNNVFSAPKRSSYHGFVNVSGATDVIIEGNEFSDIGHDGSTEIISSGVQLQSGSNVLVRGNAFVHWPTAGTSRVVNAVKMESNIRNATVEENSFQGNGRSGCYGIHMVGSGSSVHGVIRNNVLKSAKFQPNGVPNSGNTVQ